MLLVTLCAAGGWMFSREALQGGLPPLLFMGVRFLLAGLLLAAIGAGQLRRLGRADLLRAGATGLVMGVAMLCWILGLHHASHVGVGAFITSLGVILVPVVGRLAFGVHVTASTWAAVLAAAAGMSLLSLESGLRFALSDLYFLATAVALAVQFNLNSRYVARIPVVALTAVQLLVVGVMELVISLFAEAWPAAVSAGVLGWLAASILIATSLRFFLQIQAQGMAPVSHAALIMTLEPVWTALLGMVWLGERMNGLQLAGCAMIFLALLISRWRWLLRRPRPRAVQA